MILSNDGYADGNSIEILQRQRHRLIQRLMLGVFAMLLSSLPAFCQPLPPPEPVAAVNFWELESLPWADGFGNPAAASVNVTTVPSWDYAGTALSVDSVLPAYVQEPFFRGVHSNMDFLTGAFSVWLQPNWTSTTDGGTGPAVSWDSSRNNLIQSAGMCYIFHRSGCDP